MSSRNSDDSSRPGIAGDFGRLRTNGAEVAAELSDFVAKMKGRNPQEVLGEIAKSSLTAGVISASVWTVIVMVVLTVIPFGMAKAFPPAKPLAADASATEKSEPAEKAPAKAEPNTTAAAGTGNPNDPDGKLLKKLNMDETKTADPKVNPLDALGNDLLKDLK